MMQPYRIWEIEMLICAYMTEKESSEKQIYAYMVENENNGKQIGAFMTENENRIYAYVIENENNGRQIYAYMIENENDSDIDLCISDRIFCCCMATITLRWRHNELDGVSDHQPHGCLLNRLFGRRSKKTSKLASLAFVRGIHRGPVNSPHKWPVTWKMFPFDDVIMT